MAVDLSASLRRARGRTPLGRRLVALVPAHDEAATIAAAIDGLLSQQILPTHLVVVADNCADETETIARRHGAEVFTTVDNTFKKAGALNQALDQILPGLDDDDLVLVQDADSALGSSWTSQALEHVDEHRCVGGVFHAEDGHGLIGQFQRNEYQRYSWDVQRRRDKAMVLTGTASMFRVDLLREIANARGRTLPGEPGQVYDTLALTEDNEITLAAKTLGASPVSPPGCAVTTEIMPTWRALWKQRLRWQRGAVENLRHYGLSRTTRPYFFQQGMLALGTVMMLAYLVLTAFVLVEGSYGVKPLWIPVGLVFVAERLYSVWGAGRRARLLSVLMVPEILYAAFLQAVLLVAYLQILTKRTARWEHVPNPQLKGA